MTVRETRLAAGCDLGKTTAKFVKGVIGADGKLEITDQQLVFHEGEPMAAFRAWYAAAEIASCATLGATGLHADELDASVVNLLPDDVCLETSLSSLDCWSGPLNVLRVGARGYSVLTRDAAGKVQYLENDRCSCGTGETIVKIVSRFGLTVEEADRMAFPSATSIPITARCSVFAKSELTHFANQGRPIEGLLRGFFASVASYLAALLARARVEGPVLLLGGCSRMESLVAALGDAIGASVVVPAEAQHFEARGAALLATQLCDGARQPLPPRAESLIVPRTRRIRALAPAKEFRAKVVRLDSPPVEDAARRQPCVLGLDLGSTGTKAVLTNIQSRQMVLDVYDRTRGNPVEAAQRVVASILHDVDVDIRAIGVTGSGREAVATVLRAVYPDRVDRVVVINEIVAHATAAIRCDPDRGRSLSVVEIGGQDAKFIQIMEGRVVESDMNRACSAGTGSFLEEQAALYGYNEITELTRLAQEAERPPDLGQMCTVFVAETAAEAHNEGYSVADIFGGFQYSVINNYLNRVMGQRAFAERILFQGKPATGPSLAWTLAAVTGRQVIVPPNPGAMGAWGIGLCTIDDLGAEQLLAAAAVDLTALQHAEIVGRDEFQCRDPSCKTLCTIEKTFVRVAAEQQEVLSGGACPKFEVSTAQHLKLPMTCPDGFEERREALAPFMSDSSGSTTVGVPLVTGMHGIVPWVVTLLRELGLGVHLLTPTRKSLSRGEELCYSFDVCAPAKIAHGVMDASVDTVFMPRLVTVDFGHMWRGRTCPMEQAIPEMVHGALKVRGRTVEVIRPALDIDGARSLNTVQQLAAVARRFGVARSKLRNAVREANRVQSQMFATLNEIGRRTLRYGRDNGAPVVVVCGALHSIHDRVLDSGIPKLLRQNGVLALPMDCFPVPDDVPALQRIVWVDSHRALRTAAAARGRGDVYPLWVSSYGCGPASHCEQIFTAMMKGHVHYTLESDGHGGAAGYQTRIQAFLHAVRDHDGSPSQVPAHLLRILEPLPNEAVAEKRDCRLVSAAMTDHLSELTSAVLRSRGLDAVATGPGDAEALALGRRDCSGKECLAYQMLWGSFRKFLEDNPSDKPTVLLQISGMGLCRYCLFSVKDMITLSEKGWDDQVSVRHIEAHPRDRKYLDLGIKSWLATVVWEIFYQLAAYYRPVEESAGEVDGLYHSLCLELREILGRPHQRGIKGLAVGERARRDVLAVVDRGTDAFAAIAARQAQRQDLRTVLLSGDFFVRLDEWANGDLIRQLNRRGLRVLVEPLTNTIEYVAMLRLNEVFGVPTDLVGNALARPAMTKLRHVIYERVRRRHPWLPILEIAEILDASTEVMDRYPLGEPPITVGSVIHHWNESLCDGAVFANPWGCGFGLASEALLRPHYQIPMLFVYCDGAPIDERRIHSFAFRLRSQQRRTVH